MTVAIVGCPHCDGLWLVQDLRDQEHVECRHCGHRHQADKLRALQEADSVEVAQHLRAKILANRAGQLEEFEQFTGGESLEERAQARLDRHDDLFGAAVDLDAGRDEWALLNERPIHTDAFVDDVSDTPWYADAFDDDVELEPLPDEVADDFAGPSDAAGFSICEQPPVGAAGYLPDPPLQPTEFWTRLVEQSSLDAQLEAAVETLVGDEPLAEAARKLVEDYHVRAIGANETDGGRYADEIVQLLRGDDDPRYWEALRLTRRLGRAQPDGIQSTTQDVRDGPLQLLAAAGVTPTVVVGLPEGFRDDDVHHEQRSRWLSLLADLAEVMDVRLRVSSLEATWLATHRAGDDLEGDLPLPSVVSERAHPSLPSQGGNTAKQSARQAVEDLGVDAPHWTLLEVIGEPQSEQASYHAIRNDQRLTESWDALRRQLKTLGDADLIHRWGPNNDKKATLLPAGRLVLDEVLRDSRWRDAAETTACAVCGSTIDRVPTTDDGLPRCAVDVVAEPVSDPRTLSAGAVLPPRQGRGTPPARPAVEGEAVASAGADPRPVETHWLSEHRHHALAASAPEDGGFALDDRAVESWDDPRGAGISYDDLRDELVLEVEWDGPVALAARLCAAFTDDRIWSKVLPAGRLDEEGDGEFSGLVEDNRYILRRTRCLGYLKDAYTAQEFIDALVDARQDALAMTDNLRDSSGAYDAEVASAVLREAHGIIGTVKQLLDLAGVDVVQHVRLPDFSKNLRDKIGTLLPFLATATSIGARYGHYNAHRVLHEPREEKREDLLSAPQVVEPTGTLVGSWVLSGPGVHDLTSHLQHLPDHLELQEDGMKFERFLLDVSVERAHRREAVAETLARLERMKRLEPTRQATSLLYALTGSPIDVATSVGRGLAPEALGHGRDLELAEIRTALTALEPARILPDVHGPALSRIVHALLGVDYHVSTSELAMRAGCTEKTVAKWRDQLEALGLIDVEDQGEGNSTLHRFRLPFKSERREEDAPRPAFLDDEDTPTAMRYRIHDALQEALANSGTNPILEAPDLWYDLVDGDVDATALAEEWPWIEEWLEVLVAMVGERSQRAPPPPAALATSVKLGDRPPSEQVTLSTAVAD